jgi:hypothetical protein
MPQKQCFHAPKAAFSCPESSALATSKAIFGQGHTPFRPILNYKKSPLRIKKLELGTRNSKLFTTFAPKYILE